MPSLARRVSSLPEGTYVELVRSVFATLAPTTIMGILFIATAMFVGARSDDGLLFALAVAGSGLSLIRVLVLLIYERSITGPAVDASAARRAERRFGLVYLSFAFVLGLYGARSLLVSVPALHMIVVALLVGYAAGVASGISLRPWVAVPAVVLAIFPSIVSALLSGDAVHRMLGFILAMFMAGGLGSMVARYRGESENITRRQLFGSLARTDPLTGLSNRLGLIEHFNAVTASPGGECLIALHCLDLDRFKPVNDRYGHPVGDALLRAVAGRLQRVVRDGDVVGRLGGDEFAILQTIMRHPEEAQLMAHRIAKALSEPFSIDSHMISIGTSVGYAVSPGCKDHLDDLMKDADAALYRAKSQGGGIARGNVDSATDQLTRAYAS